jgi:hypothetical protein
MWMPLLAVLLVLLSVATLLLYVLPTAKSRLSGYAEDRAVALADAAAYAAAESGEGRALRRELRLLTDGEGGEVLVVDEEGQVVERVGGDRLLSPPSEELLQRAAEGERINDSIGEQRVAMVPVVREGYLAGGVIFAPGDSEDILYQLFTQRDRGGGGGLGARRWPRAPFGYPPRSACREDCAWRPRNG